MNNQFNILDFACGTQDTGPLFPQIQEMSKGYDYDAENSVDELAKFYDTLPSFEPNLDAFILHKQAKPTDFLSNSLTSVGYLVSEKAKTLLSQFNLPEHKFYPASVLHKNEPLKGYYWLQIINDFRKFVDYGKSHFFIYQNFSKNAGSIKIQSEQDYLEKNSSIRINDPTLCIWANKISFTDKFPSHLDFFALSKFNSNTFVSKKLSQSLMDHIITGLVIKSTNIIA